MFSVQNIGLWAFPMLIGAVLDSSNPDYISEMNTTGAMQKYNCRVSLLRRCGRPQ
ncbi:MAG: hypothetical protein U5L09_22815 [Bacteroidales bacterium]|nr:hypothetical protein [Bacteroidales bacterium]